MAASLGAFSCVCLANKELSGALTIYCLLLSKTFLSATYRWVMSLNQCFLFHFHVILGLFLSIGAQSYMTEWHLYKCCTEQKTSYQISWLLIACIVVLIVLHSWGTGKCCGSGVSAGTARYHVRVCIVAGGDTRLCVQTRYQFNMQLSWLLNLCTFIMLSLILIF